MSPITDSTELSWPPLPLDEVAIPVVFRIDGESFTVGFVEAVTRAVSSFVRYDTAENILVQVVLPPAVVQLICICFQIPWKICSRSEDARKSVFRAQHVSLPDEEAIDLKSYFSLVYMVAKSII